VVVLVVLSSCFWRRESEVVGVFALAGAVNTFDTLYLKPGGVYERLVYNLKRERVLRYKGKWEYYPDRIILHSWFLNLDRDLVKFPELAADTGLVVSTGFDVFSIDTVTFCTGYLPDEHCYKRVRGGGR